MHELGQILLIEVRTGLPRVRDDLVRIDADQSGTGDRDQIILDLDSLADDRGGGRRELRTGEEHVDRPLGGIGSRNESADPAPQSRSFGHQCPFSFSLALRAISTAASRYATAPTECAS